MQLAAFEQASIARQADVQRVTCDGNNSSVKQGVVDQPDHLKAYRHLVHHARGVPPEARQKRDIFLGPPFKLIVECRDYRLRYVR